MQENLSPGTEKQNNSKNSALRSFFLDVVAGFGIGVAFIIPGFSGGSIAAILGIYEKLVGAVADIFRDFKRSVITLIPIFIGLVLGAVSLIYPLGWALEAFPLPTVSLFVGLAIGGIFSLTDKVKGRVLPTNVIAFALPALVALGLCFVPVGSDVNLLDSDFLGYVLLFIVGIIGSAALIVPGISGSMLLLIFGYYNPIIRLITDNFFAGVRALEAFFILLTVGLGIIVGFIGISVIMKHLLKKYPRGTYFAIIGFIVGSIPTVFVSTSKEAGYALDTLPGDPFHWIACVLLLALGFALSFLFVMKAKKSVKNEKGE